MKNSHLKLLIFFLIINFLQGKYVFSVEKVEITDTILVYSIQKCAEHIYQKSLQDPSHNKGKPIYWAKVISMNLVKNEWEVVFTETDRKKTFMVADFRYRTIIDNEQYLLLIDYDNMFGSSETQLDSTVFTEEFIETEHTDLRILFVDIIYCRIKYQKNKKFSVFCKWWYSYKNAPGRLKVFQYIKLNTRLDFYHERLIVEQNIKFTKSQKKIQRYNRKHTINYETERYKF